MVIDRTSCVHRGATFFGEVHIFGDGPDALVRVRYKGEQMEAKAAGRLAETVAHHLLRELVVLEAVAVKAAAADRALAGAGAVHDSA